MLILMTKSLGARGDEFGTVSYAKGVLTGPRDRISDAKKRAERLPIVAIPPCSQIGGSTIKISVQHIFEPQQFGSIHHVS
jgi:hypothetical protein